MARTSGRRLVAPLSTAIVTSRRPTLRWVLPPSLDGAHVEICRDRACAIVIKTVDAAGTRGRPSTDLPTGVVFWRVLGRAGTVTGSTWSRTWKFAVDARTAAVDASWGTVGDVNGDGYADVVVGANGALRNTGKAFVYLGSATGLGTAPATALTGPDGDGNLGSSIASAGDVIPDPHRRSGRVRRCVGVRELAQTRLCRGGFAAHPFAPGRVWPSE